MSLLKTYSVLNTVAAASADLVIEGGVLRVAGTVGNKFPRVDYLSIQKGGSKGVAYTPETLQIATITIAATNNTRYSFAFTQLINGTVKSQTFNYISDATGTAAEIGAAIKGWLESLFQVTVSVTGSVSTVTAVTGSPIFVAVNVSNTVVLVTTPGVIAAYTGAQLVALGITDATVGQNYHYWNFTYVRTLPSNNTIAKGEEIEHTLFILDGTDGDTLLAELQGTLDGSSATFFPEETASVANS